MEKNKIPPTAMVTDLRRLRRRAQKHEPGDVAGLTHKIVNQLTVINLTCFKLRAVVRRTSAVDPADIARLEDAVEEMHALVESLVRLEDPQDALSGPLTKRSRRQPAKSTNVYRLADAQNFKR